MARILRGDIWWAGLDPVLGHEQGGHRPVLILSTEPYNFHTSTVIAMAITAQPQRMGYPVTYALPDQLLPKQSWVKIGQIRTLAVERLGRRICRLGEEEMVQIIGGFLELIGS